MGDNNIIRGKVTSREGDRLVIEDAQGIRASVLASGDGPAVGDDAMVAVRAAAVTTGGEPADANTAECEVVFVEFLGDLVKIHLTTRAGERLLAKVPGDQYASLRGREGETMRISWKEEDVQLLGA
jgi:ABC-type Fe3+/spermidine/putrescine transport system ATPase subunit